MAMDTIDRRVVVQLIVQLGWTEVVLVTDLSDFSEEDPRHWVNSLSHHHVQHVLVSGSEALSKEWLQDLVKTGADSWRPLHFILLCSLACVTSALSRADRLQQDMGTQSAFALTSKWLLIQEAGQDLSVQLQVTNITMDHVTIVRIQEQRKKSRHGPSETHFMVHSLIWRLGRREWSQTQSVDLVASAPTPGGARDYTTLFFPNVEGGYNQHCLTVIVKEWSSYVIAHEENGGRRWTGLLLDLLNVASDRLNFTYRLVDATDMKWGTGTALDPDTGLYGFVIRQDVDLALAATEFTSSRYDVMDFPSAVTFWNVVMLYRKPPVTLDPRMPLGPLGTEVAVAVLGSMMLVSVFLTTLQVLEKGDRDPVASITGRGWRMLIHLDKALQMTGAALLSEPSHEQPTTQAGRVLLCSWWLLSLVVAAAYSGTLTAFLSTSTQPRLFSSPQDLLTKDHSYTWGTIGDSSFQFMFEYSNQTVPRALWSGMKGFAASDPDLLSSDITTLVHKVKSQDFVLFFPGLTAAALLGGDCLVDMVDAGMRQSLTSVVLPKGSSLTRPLSDLILDLHASGLLSQWTDRWFPRASCPLTSSDSMVISLMHVQGVLLVLPVGVGLALGVLLLERVYSRIRNKHL